MEQEVVGIAEWRVSADPSARLVTYSLGSCIGLAIHDPIAKVGGLLHFMLPDSTIDREKAQRHPGMFADTGVPLLFRSAYSLGLDKRRVRVVVAGGSQILDDSGRFNIGKRNYAALRSLLWKNNVLITAQDVGGCQSRTLYLEVGTGKVWISEANRETKVLLNGETLEAKRSP